MNKQDFLALQLNHLAQEGIIKADFYKDLLTGLHSNEVVLESEETNSSDVLQKIFNSIDWKMLDETEFGEDEFFNGEDGLYTSIGNQLQDLLSSAENDYKRRDLVGNENNWWTNSYWNESVAKLLQILAQRIDPENIIKYERSGLLIELIDPEGKIDTEHLRGGISANGATAELRIIDIMDADAGNSFEGEHDTYWYGNYYDTVIFSYTINEEQIHESVCTKVLFKEEADKYFAKITSEEEFTLEEFNDFLDNCVYSGKIIKDTTNFKKTVITMQSNGESRFKVVKNPWVIPWYNFDAETYSYVRGEDKKLSALTDKKKLDFTREKVQESPRWIRLLMPRYKRKVEVEDLNRNFWVIGQVLAGISADLFDEDGPIGGMIKGLLKEIGQLWENMIYLWMALALLSQKKFYGETYSEVVIVPTEKFLPYLKYDKFDEFVVSDAVKQVVKNNLNYLIQMYPTKNLAILPQVRINNYEWNYFETVWYPGVYIYDRNAATPEWQIYPFYTNKEMIVHLNDFTEHIYGILETEEMYAFLAPLSKAGDLSPERDTRYYGLVRDNIDFAANLYDFNINTETWIENKQISIEFKYEDLARKLVTGSSQEILDITSVYNTSSDKMETTTIYTAENEEPLEEVSFDQVMIKKGYYQGELLSTCLDAYRRILTVSVMKNPMLEPVFDDAQTLRDNYAGPSYAAVRQKDETVLQALLKLAFEFNLQGEEVFWTNHDAEDIYQTPENFFGEYNANQDALQGKKTRELAPYSRFNYNQDPNNYLKYYEETKQSLADGLEKWKALMKSQLTAITEGPQINKDSIVLITGSRDYSYMNDGGASQQIGTTCYQYLPYNENGEYNGFIAPMFDIVRGRSSIETGSALMFKVKDDSEAYGFYPSHRSITSRSSLGGGIHNPFIWDETVEYNGVYCQGWAVKSRIDGPASEDIYTAIRYLITTNTDANLIRTSLGGGVGGGDQYLTMIRDGQKDFTETNWRVVHLVQYAIEPNLVANDAKTNFQRYYRSLLSTKDIIYEGLLRKYADELYNNGLHGIKELGDALKDYFIDDGGTAGIKLSSYYTGGTQAQKDAVDAMVSYFEDKYTNWRSDTDPHTYFYYQGILHGQYPPIYSQQCWIYNHVGTSWSTEAAKIYEEFKDEALEPVSSCGLKDPEGNTFEDRYFINGVVATDVGVYVYGPKDPTTNEYLYARRAYYRELDQNGIPKYVAPIEEFDTYGTVDDLRAGYTVVSATNNKIELEKYKTKWNGKYRSDYYNNVFGQFPDDDNTYSTVWDESYIDFE